MNEIDKKYRRIRKSLDTLTQVDGEFIEEESLKEAYDSPFHKLYELKNIIEKIREELIQFTVRKEESTHCPNLTIDIPDLRDKLDRKYGLLGFSSAFIASYIKRKYLAKSDKLSYNEILEEAKKLRPVLWGDHGRKKVKLEDIHEKNRLILRLYREGYFYYNHRPLAAIEKLTNILIDQVSPTTVWAYFLPPCFSNKAEDLYGTHKTHDKNIVKARNFKNGKLILYFKDEETARKVGEALIRR